MTQTSQGYSTNTIIANRYNIDNVIDSEIENSKKQTKIHNKYKRNVYIQKFDNVGKPVQVGFLHNDGKLKSNIYYNKQGQPIREIYHSNYGIGDYTAISDFIYDSSGNLKQVKTRIDDGAVLIQEY
ncbi:MAG: hypothetical protein ACI4S3_01255 [Candidatus Gastranaerophilaceae bacterium]